MQKHCLKSEGPFGEIGKAIMNFQEGYSPQLLFIFVDKKSSVRLFLPERMPEGREQYRGGRDWNFKNPAPGTIFRVPE